MSPLSPLHIPTSHTICNPGQTWGLQDWLTGSANMFLSWLPSFKLWPHLHIIRAQSWWATQWSGSDTASAQTFSPSSQKQAIQRFATQTLHIINTSQPSQRASILQSTKPVNQNTNTFPYINDGRVVVWLIQTILYWLVIQLQVQRITIYNMLMDGLMGSEGLDHWPGPGLWHQAINSEMEIPPDNKYQQYWSTVFQAAHYFIDCGLLLDQSETQVERRAKAVKINHLPAFEKFK